MAMLPRINILRNVRRNASTPWHPIATCHRVRVAFIAHTASKQTQHAAPRRATPTFRPRPYIKPEDHQAPEPPNASPKGPPVVGERMQIYHCGAPRAVTVATVKVTNLLMLAGFCGYGYSSGAPLGAAAAILAQLAWTFAWAYVSSPLVVSIWLRTPPRVKSGSEAIRRWLHALPADTLLELRTFRLHGQQKTTVVKLGELRRYQSPWWRAANVERVGIDGKGGKLVSDGGTTVWWKRLIDLAGEPRNRFFINWHGALQGKETTPLQIVLRSISRTT